MRKAAPTFIFVAIVGLVVCSSCSSPDQTAENTSNPNADRVNEQKRNTLLTWWTDPEITAEMNLTEEQTTQIKAIMVEARAQAGQRADLERRAATRFHRVIGQEKSNPEQIDRLSEELEQILAVRNEIRINRIRKMREVLTQEQWEKLWQLAPEVLQVGHVKVFRGPSVYVTDGTPVPGTSAAPPAEPNS